MAMGELQTAVTAAARFAVSIHCKKNKKAKEAERRQTQGVLSEPRERMLPLARASGPARAEAQRARLSAFRRGTCGGERTPPLNSSPHFLGPGVIGCYPHLACPFSPASCLAVPVVVPDGRNLVHAPEPVLRSVLRLSSPTETQAAPSIAVRIFGFFEDLKRMTIACICGQKQKSKHDCPLNDRYDNSIRRGVRSRVLDP